jgi:hypothetical protein
MALENRTLEPGQLETFLHDAEVAVQEEVAGGRLAELYPTSPVGPEHQMMLISRSDRYLTATARSLMDLLGRQLHC